MSERPRNLAQEAEDLADGKKVPAALPERLGYRRVGLAWLREVAKELADSDYREKMLRLALAYCPQIDPCPDCGNPRMEGAACDFCPPAAEVPPSQSHPDWYVSVNWDLDHGWLVEEPREDDGAMEETWPEAYEGDRPTMKEAVAWGREVAKRRQLPLRIYHKVGNKVTTVPPNKLR